MSSTKFYRLLADPDMSSRWYIKSPLDPAGNEIDPRLFTQGIRVRPQLPLILPLRRKGDRVGFNFCDFDMVVTPTYINAQLEALVGSAIQRIPVTVDAIRDEFEILNVCELIQCVDEKRSTLTKWTEADARSEKTGQYRMITKLAVDSVSARGHHIFRVAGWPIALIASEDAKALFEAEQLSGLKYEPVG